MIVILLRGVEGSVNINLNTAQSMIVPMRSGIPREVELRFF
jgi:hypothetical protein